MKNAISIKDFKIGYDKKIIIEELSLSIEEGRITSNLRKLPSSFQPVQLQITIDPYPLYNKYIK